VSSLAVTVVFFLRIGLMYWWSFWCYCWVAKYYIDLL